MHSSSMEIPLFTCFLFAKQSTALYMTCMLFQGLDSSFVNYRWQPRLSSRVFSTSKVHVCEIIMVILIIYYNVTAFYNCQNIVIAVALTAYAFTPPMCVFVQLFHAQSGFHLTVERDWFWFWFWFYYALCLASVFHGCH